LLSAAIEGTVTNGTTGKPQAAAVVTLVKLGQGMETLGSVKTDAQGRFSFAHDMAPQTPYLIQGMHEGVNYSKMLQPGTAATGIAVEVYNSSASEPKSKLTEHVIFLQPDANGLAVNEIIAYQNDGKITYNNPKGTFRFLLPQSAGGKVRVSVNTAAGMPVQRPAVQTGAENVWAVQHALKPGETRFDISYVLPSAEAFETKQLREAPLRVVVPAGVQLAGDNLKQLATEPNTQAVIYEASGTEIALKISGSGSLSAAAPAAEEEDPSGGITQAKPRLYNRLYWILALTLVMLGLGFVLLYRKDAAERR
jgi:hypothetical protein